MIDRLRDAVVFNEDFTYFMRLTRATTVAIFCLVAVAGCSTRPLPKDVTRIPSYKIALKIRCELREAVQKGLKGYLSGIGRSDLAVDLAGGRLAYQRFFDVQFKQLSPKVQDLVNRFRKTAVVYKFKFDIVEDNNLSGNVSFISSLTRGPFSLAMSGTKNKKRSNVREFAVLDTWGDLITSGVMRDECNRVAGTSAQKKHSYPIGGKVGMEAIVSNFFALVQSGNLITSAENLAVPTMTDTLTFTTTVSGTINPKIELNPVGRGLELASAGINKTWTRTDVHQMISVFFIPEKELSGITVGQQRGRLRAIVESGELRPVLKELERASARTEENVLVVLPQ